MVKVKFIKDHHSGIKKDAVVSLSSSQANLHVKRGFAVRIGAAKVEVMGTVSVKEAKEVKEVKEAKEAKEAKEVDEERKPGVKSTKEDKGKQPTK